MRIRGERLQEALADLPKPHVMLRDYDCTALLSSALSFAEAFALTVRDQVEGVATASGRLKYLRLLSSEELDQLQAAQRQILGGETSDPDGPGGGCHVPGNARMGVWKEPVMSSSDKEGDAGMMIGHVFHHYASSV